MYDPVFSVRLVFTANIDHTQNMPSNREKLAALIFTRRTDDLGMTQEELAEAAGLRPMTVSDYEKGKIPDRPQRRTLNGFDRALQWELGSSAAVLDGGEPTLANVRAKVLESRARNTPDGPDGTRWATVSFDDIADLATKIANMAAEADSLPDMPEQFVEGLNQLRMESAYLLVSALGSRRSDEALIATAEKLEQRQQSRG